MTYAELYKKTAVLAEAFKRAGVKKGDCIAGNWNLAVNKLKLHLQKLTII